MQCIHWYPVSAMNKDRFIINDESKLSGFSGEIYIIHIQLYSANPNFTIVDIQLFSIRIYQLHTCIVERSFTVAPRPPKINILKFEYMTKSRSAYNLRILIYDFSFTTKGKLSLHFVKLIKGDNHLYICKNTCSMSRCIDVDGHPIYIFETSRIEYPKFNISPQSGTDQTGHNIPSIHVRSLSHINSLLCRKITNTDRTECMFLSFHNSRTDNYLQSIFSSFEKICHVICMLN